MLSKCANPDCSATFLYLHEGKLFRIQVETSDSSQAAGDESTKLIRQTEFFWLCPECSASMTLTFNRNVGVRVRSLSPDRAMAS